MKIDAYLNGVLEKYVKQAKAQRTEKTTIKEKPESQVQAPSKDIDKVEISPQAKLLLGLLGDEDAKAQRLKEVKAKLENGSYKPPIEEIAKSILKEWKGE